MPVVCPEFQPGKEVPESITFARFKSDGSFDGTFQVYPKLYKFERTLEYALRSNIQAYPLKGTDLNFPEGKSDKDLRIDDIKDQFMEGRALELTDFELEDLSLELLADGLKKGAESRRTKSEEEDGREAVIAG